MEDPAYAVDLSHEAEEGKANHNARELASIADLEDVTLGLDLERVRVAIGDSWLSVSL